MSVRLIRVAVIGGGISGLTCAMKLAEQRKADKIPNLEILLFEKGPGFGGTIATEHKDGFLLEKGPDAFITEKPWATALCRRLGLEEEIQNTRDEHRRSFVVKKGVLTPLPQGFYMVAPTQVRAFLASPLLSLPGRLRMLLEVAIPRNRGDQDETVASFIRRRFGAESLERVGQAMLAGIYAGDPEKLSISATMPRFVGLERKYGSVIRGLIEESDSRKEKLIDLSGPRYSLFTTLKQGMQTLIDRLVQEFPHGTLHSHSDVRELLIDNETGKWKLLVNDQEYLVDAICMTQPAFHCAELLSKIAPEISQKLARIDYESVMTLNMAYRREDVGHALDGFGFVSPRVEKNPVFACSFSSQKFEGRAPEGSVLLRAFIGGAFGKEIVDREDADIVEMAHNNLSKLLKIRSRPLFSSLQRYRHSMVQYGLNHLQLVAEIREATQKMGGLYLTGAAYGGVGIPDCIREAETAGEEIYRFVFEKLRRDYEAVLFSKIWKP